MSARRGMGRALLWLGCGFALSGSALGGEAMQLSGKLIYVGSISVATELNLATLERREIYKRDEKTSLRSEITHVNHDTFVIAQSDNQLYLVTPGQSAKKLGPGSKPVYFPKHQKLLFTSSRPEEARPRLYEARLVNDELREIKEIHAGPFGLANPFLAISEDEAVVYWPHNNAEHHYRYKLNSGALEPLPIKNCRPVGWRAATQQLICENPDGPPFAALLSLDGKGRVDLPKLRGIAKGPYLMAQDILLGSRGRIGLRGETYDLVAYDFKTNTIEKIAEEIAIASGWAYWTE